MHGGTESAKKNASSADIHLGRCTSQSDLGCVSGLDAGLTDIGDAYFFAMPTRKAISSP